MWKNSSSGPSLRVMACACLAAMALASCGGGSTGSGVGADSGASQANASAALSETSIGSGTLASTGSVQPTTTPSTDSTTVQAGSASATAVTTVSASTAPQVIEYYGDSTIWGYGSGTGVRVATPAPAAFAAALPASGNYDVRNEGVNGSTACKLLNGADTRHPAWSQQMANSAASIVIMNFAINDEWQDDLTTYKSCLTQLARQAKSYGKKVIFETPNPTRDSGPYGLDVYVNAMKSVAVQERLPVIDLYQYLTNYLNGQSPLSICPDGLHPTDAVYVMKGKYAASAFSVFSLFFCRCFLFLRPHFFWCVFCVVL